MASSKSIRWKNWLLGMVKIALSALAIGLIARKVNWESFKAVLHQIDFQVLVFAFMIYNISQLLGAVRSRYYLKTIGIKLDHKANSYLYYLGMFYNLFLPGGVGGDAYKVYFLKKYYPCKTIEIIKALLFDRINGLVGLIMLAVMAIYGMKLVWLPWMTGMTTCAMILVLGVVFFTIHQMVIKSSWKNFSHTLSLSIGIQCLQALSAVLIIRSLGEHTHQLTYVLIFLTSSIAMQLPLSMGGIGAREVTVVYCLNMLHIDPTIGLAMAMLYFLIQSLSNCIGVFFLDFTLSQPSRIKQ